MIRKYPLLFVAIILLALIGVSLLVSPMLASAEGEVLPLPTSEAVLPTQPTAVPSTDDPSQAVPTLPDTEEAQPAPLTPEYEVNPAQPPSTEISPAPEESAQTPTESFLTPGGDTPTIEVTLTFEETITQVTVDQTDEAELDETPVPDEMPLSTEITLTQVPMDQAWAPGQLQLEATPALEGINEEEQPCEEELPDPTEQVTAEVTLGADPYIDRLDGRYYFMPPGGCDAYGGVSATCSESSTPFQAAIDAAQDGETVNVQAGTYTEQIQIFDISLTLKGYGSPTIMAPGTLSAIDSVYAIIYASNASVYINGFVIDGSTTTDGDTSTDNQVFAIYLVDSGGVISSNTVISNNSTDDHTYGIEVNNTDGAPRTVTISSNDVVDYTAAGIQVQGDNLSSRISYNDVTSSAAPESDSAAIAVHDSGGHIVQGNRVDGENVRGVLIVDSHNNIISANLINDASENGIRLVNSSGNTIMLNVISGIDSTADSSAISLDENSDNNIIANNILRNNSIAVEILNGSDNTTVTQNHIENNAVGVKVAADPAKAEPTNTTLYWNIIAGNTSAVINETSNSVYATYNWWGCSQGQPTCGGTISGPVYTGNPLTSNPDPDYDLIFNPFDNCPFVYNPSQLDLDGDGIGNACEELEVRKYIVYAEEKKEDLEAHDIPLSTQAATDIQLVKLHEDGSEEELASVFALPEVAAEGTQLTFLQVLKDTLPKPLKSDTFFVGPGFDLDAHNDSGKQLKQLEGDLELRWILPTDLEVPSGYHLAVQYFNSRTFLFITEKWKDVPVDIEDGQAVSHADRMGTYVLVFAPD